ncbi:MULTISPECIES: alpha/beta fold hydrolase [unclassified Pseudomonas]|uniref:alpha/beta hydrolase family protein n=1 Tax=unclassified Pseudomonas TaxID=196821 RepID=UPI000C884582|nr:MULTISPECIES: alpha/beta fold hydrolase [unclassified Pseudomonas]PMZ70447.1 dienelactone hydrolase [Pseudomonas sp. GW247-3R2A]PMY63803.1 dienelactone hydrolase [Pseudomonas sp. MPR-R3A]PMY95711.1 dienelactone hydrolase [Pseudomonas sp. FW305-124]PNA94026.1 dienelactone hydrolase [Pseudomonas sp. FW300-E2]PNA94314.1 dienelactone hydrolase [Pseudomonas sp. MPR-AND1B]
MKAPLAALLLISLTGPALANDPIGFQTTTIPDTHNIRPLEMAVWYPATSTAQPKLIADNLVFIGVLAVPDAAPTPGKHPVVVLSHGYGGNWGKQAWLASALARQGYIVAAVNHPGTTSQDRSAQAAAQLWQRPKDLSRAIDALLVQPTPFGAVDSGRIAVIGHSLGGWTVMESAGARFDPALFARDCNAHPTLVACTAYREMNPEGTPNGKAQLAADLSDNRVTAVVSLDLGLSRGFTDASLAALPVPALVIAAGEPSADLPAQMESADMAKRLPKMSTQYVEIQDANHFSFMSQCKPGAAAVLDADVPGDSMICQDGEGARPRPVIQQQVITLISEFLAR